ncbi:MAG: hypothetical protein JSS20_20545 [Proteobacteria bacterium]|nr:hypothetical protein [Pseudomonadota bacterium]
MGFDPHLKEMARAQVALSRLADVRERMVTEKKSAQQRFDFIVRSMAVVAIFWLIY